MKDKNAACLAELKLTSRFYREQHNTICLLIDEGGMVVARGVSICSPKDQFVKKTGRNKAQGQALRAVAHKVDMGELPYKLYVEGQTPFMRKAHYMPQYLSPEERKIVDKVRGNLNVK